MPREVLSQRNLDEIQSLLDKENLGTYNQDVLSIFFEHVYNINISVLRTLEDVFKLLEPEEGVTRIYIFQSGIHFQSLITNEDIAFLIYGQDIYSTKANEMIKYNNDN